MLLNDAMARKLSRDLLRIGAVRFNAVQPFRWASGWLSPIYTDNRLTLSYPDVRRYIRTCFLEAWAQRHLEADVIAGVATGGIAHGVLLADALEKPFVYVRSSPKSHGLGNQVEGRVQSGQPVVVVEDLVSTGGSSLNAVQALRALGARVQCMLAIFDYDFPQKQKRFQAEGVELLSLTNYETCLQEALNEGHLQLQDHEILAAWRQAPESWQPYG
ncbi:MAG: orotate phosphoribosyltransferase [Flavobacteriales bacterium]|nr:orotate phosphoribosyltransferase [Flavobacteriales bacterium]MDW8432971.1 orotate phosphoribosyltransferase [Flavobacteriales bacterium]